MRGLICRLLRLNDAEVTRLLKPASCFLLLMTAIILGRNVRDSLFLKQVGLAYLPYMYVLNALFVAGTAAFCAALIDRLDRVRFVAGSFLLYAIAAIVMRFLTMTGSPLLTVVSYVVVQLIWVLGMLQFWTLTGDLFDPREAKWAYPLIGVGGLVGMMVAGFGASPLVRVVGTENLFFAIGLLLAGSAVVASKMAPARRAADTEIRHPPPKAAEPHSRPFGFGDQLTAIARSPLLRGLALVTLLLWLAFTLLDFQFNRVAREAYPDKDQLTAFFGLFRGLAGGLCLMVQFGLTPLFLSRLGVGRAIAVHPALIVVAAAGMTGSFGFLTTSLAKFGDHVILYTVQESSYQMLFNAVPADRRGRSRAFIDGTLKPVAMGLGGLVVVLASWWFTPSQISLLLFLLAVAWFGVAWGVRRAYVQSLVEILGGTAERQAEEAETLHSLRGPESLEVLSSLLQSPDPERAAVAAELVAALEFYELRPNLGRLLVSGSGQVRAASVAALGILGERSDLSAVVQCLGDADPGVRAQAAEALGSLGSEEEVESLLPLLADPDARVRTATVVALIRMGGLDGIIASVKALEGMLVSPDSHNRVEAARILGQVRGRHFVPTLLKLLRDPDADVRRKAVSALGKIRDARAVDPLVTCLSERYVGRAALEALVAVGRGSLASLLRVVSHQDEELVTRQRAAEALRRIGAEGLEQELVGLLAQRSPEVRSELLRALESCAQKRALAPEAHTALHQVLVEEIRYAYQYRFGRALFQERLAGSRGALWAEALREEELESAERALLALGAMSDPVALKGLRHRLLSSDRQARSLALEALENLGPRETVLPLVALLDPDGRGLREASAKVMSEQARTAQALEEALAADPIPLVRAALAWILSASGANGETLALLQRDPIPLVRESAGPGSSSTTEGARSMLSTIEKVLSLRTAPLFSALRREDLPHLATVSEEVEIAVGQEVFREGEPGDALYVIVEGQVAIILGEGKGEQTIALFSAPECFGELAILDDLPRSATARAVADSRLIRISREDFRALLYERPEVAFGVFRVLSSRLRQAGPAFAAVPAAGLA